MGDKRGHNKHYVMQPDVMDIVSRRDMRLYPTETDYIHAAVRYFSQNTEISSLKKRVDYLYRHLGLDKNMGDMQENTGYDLDDAYGFGIGEKI